MNNEKKHNNLQYAKAFPSGRFGGALFLLLLFSFPVFAQQENTEIRLGNNHFEQGQFVEAEIAFRRALEINPHSFEAHFNLGNALLRQEKFEEALRHYANAHALLSPENEEGRARLASVYHNLGNAFLMNGRNVQSEEEANQTILNSIEAYKNSLRLNPLDNDTRFNLAFAQHLLNNPDQRGGGGDDQQQEQEQNQEPPPQQQQPQPIDPMMSPENAQQILNTLLDDEREVQERVRQQPPPRSRREVERDW